MRHIVVYDEGTRLFQKDESGKLARGLVNMLTELYNSNEGSAGSLSAGKYVVQAANVSMIAQFTRDSFDRCFTGSGTTRDGFLSRCAIVVGERQTVKGKWRAYDKAQVMFLASRVGDCLRRKSVQVDEAADAIQQACVEQIRGWDHMYNARLEHHFTADMLLRTIFSPDGVLTPAIVEAARKWTEHQYQTRMAVWPLAISADKAESMAHALVKAHEKFGDLTHAQRQRLVNVNREGSGGVSVYWRVHRDQINAKVIECIGKNRNGREIFRLVKD